MLLLGNAGLNLTGLCIALLCLGGCSAFVAPGAHLGLRTPAGACNSHACARHERSSISASATPEGERFPLDRRAVLGAVPAFVLGSTLAAPANAFQVPAGIVQGGKGPVETDTFIQHAVLEVEDLNAEVAFWTKGLGMKVLRKRAGTVFVGYGPESLDAENGGHFALELTESDDALPPSQTLQRIELLLQYSTGMLVDAEDYGGKILPRWFGTANFVEVSSPAGYVARISYTGNKAPSPYPVKAVVQRVPDVGKATTFFTNGLMIPKASTFALPFIGDGSATLQLRAQGAAAGAEASALGVALILEPLAKDAPKPRTAEGGWKLAAVTSKREALAKQASGAGGKVLFEGKAPGTSTSVSVVEAADSSGLKVALVDVEGFKAELPTAPSLPPPPPPAAPPAQK